MPKIDIDMFDETPHEGDKVKVTGKIKSIDEDSGDVEVSYDDVSIIEDRPKHKRKYKNPPDRFYDNTNPPPEMMPNTQTLDQALAQSFPNTQ